MMTAECLFGSVTLVREGALARELVSHWHQWQTKTLQTRQYALIINLHLYITLSSSQVLYTYFTQFEDRRSRAACQVATPLE